MKIRGFTLVELLVVIAIIGLLSSVVFASLNSARVKARDARRLTDLREMRKALDLYYDANDKYPSSGWIYSTDASWSDSNTAGTVAYVLKPYLARLPKDPLNSGGAPFTEGGFTYAYNGSRESFELVGQLEDRGSPYRCYVRHYRRSSGVQWCVGDNNPAGNNGSSNFLFTNDPN